LRPRLKLDSVYRKKPAKQEKRIAAELGATRRPGSGSKDRYKGDIAHKDFLIEVKRTVKNQITIPKKWLTKIRTEARALKKYPALEFEFDKDIEYAFYEHGKWICIEYEIFKRLLNGLVK